MVSFIDNQRKKPAKACYIKHCLPFFPMNTINSLYSQFVDGVHLSSHFDDDTVNFRYFEVEQNSTNIFIKN